MGFAALNDNAKVVISFHTAINQVALSVKHPLLRVACDTNKY